MNKYEIETAILKEFEAFLPAIENMPFDKGLILWSESLVFSPFLRRR